MKFSSTLIILICGYPGVGKTTLANELGPLINAVILSTDKIRKDLIDKPNYSEEEKKLIYNILLLIAKYLHNSGINCILDATFNNQKAIEDIKKGLNLTDDQFKIVECICPEELIISRIHNRKMGYSDADVSIYRMIKENYEPIQEKHIIVDTSQSLKKIVAEVANRIKNEP
ncbi:MAG: AAA family ATPase [Deltaproteobacteria bacterium]